MDLKQGVVTRVDGKRCQIHSEQNTYHAYIPHKVIGVDPKTSKPLCVGDRVLFIEDEAEEIIVKELLPRYTKLSRRAIGAVAKEQIVASNIDQLLIVTAVYNPPFHPGIVDRFIIAAIKGDLQPVICINKQDLLHKDKNKERIEQVIETYRQLEYTVVCTSTKTQQGLDELRNILKDKTTALAGHSGVGKSSLLLTIDPDLTLVTKNISRKSRRGQHATTSVTLNPLCIGGYVVDTPGIRELNLWETSVAEVTNYYPEIAALSSHCRYRGCTHTHEPKCAVKEAVEKGEIEEFRYDSYYNVIDSIENPSMSSRPVAFHNREKPF
ncbi:ribosome small subunit-dependent GTPase A [Candidatus Uabimicrobium amorphum]|uniref:Small ribosomal subunit biogenesis GTPase RsgA n=1 Tax=Uabimicrobium amorphum TaxID=2596890 RepID=A0A5S9F446_UABAM|nr:ribosome small subunit-dependent GTPase A [Candidatus Uabimicrobium amorphum]BBM84783.1 putative ribosome biogenesis GTPase RsgA [Candidatus Uabimicrobium amorphum]